MPPALTTRIPRGSLNLVAVESGMHIGPQQQDKEGVGHLVKDEEKEATLLLVAIKEGIRRSRRRLEEPKEHLSLEESPFRPKQQQEEEAWGGA